ncbi:uncharacterized protein LOC111622388 isoform X2 [Centruroides sculpturatus]|nr:uncharacterized protein LOC111622388 isoform X2 [Centruroides sculpturatus]XP_023220520.1 uncharacterized protein LOC111622388 isoform X2 [Centruroides sculpturatus]XP_023220521.1 uncharacterized protein LOC111622388 isoform X2 [Centruroides sculpturatus]
MNEDISRRGYIKKITDRGQIPEGGIRLTEKEALKTQLDLLYNWKNKSEIWPFEFGHFVLAAAAGLGGLGFNFFYRQKLNLGSLARASTYMPAVALPAIIAPMCHSIFISSDVVIQKSSCALCVEIRSSVLQGVCGVIYPMLLVPISSFHYANKYYTYAIPPMKTNFKDIIKLWWKLTKPVVFPHSVLLFMFQAAISTYITRKEAEVIQKINDSKSSSVELL